MWPSQRFQSECIEIGMVGHRGSLKNSKYQKSARIDDDYLPNESHALRSQLAYFNGKGSRVMKMSERSDYENRARTRANFLGSEPWDDSRIDSTGPI